MNDTLTILVFTHGYFGKEIIQSAEMIGGKIDNIYSFSLMPKVSIEEFYQDAKAVIQKIPGKKIALCDLYGGTPHHVAMMLSAEFDFSMICGLNLGMLLTAVIKREAEADSSDYQDEIVKASKESIQFVPRMENL